MNETEQQLRAELAELKRQNEELTIRLSEMQQAYEGVTGSIFWRLTAPLRKAADGVKWIAKKSKLAQLAMKVLRYCRKNGIRNTWYAITDRLGSNRSYARLAAKQLYTPAELDAQRKQVFPKAVKFSILVPLYNTPEIFLREMIGSVLAQTYANWELCLADGSDSQHANVETICREYAAQEPRIRYQKLSKNLGISGNTNACIEMSTGDYLALFDHDDLLHPAALHDMMEAICEKDADFLYTDENTFHNTPKDAYSPHFKPDFAPDTLRSYNYICHFTAFRRELLAKAGGGFRPEYDGSQDFELILRLTEQAERSVHIPKILYFWRNHAGSVAGETEAKPYTLEAARKAISAHLERMGLKAVVEDNRLSSTYRIRYTIEGTPLVSIIIPNKDHIDDLDKCIRSIQTKTTYSNWEIILVENNSTEEKTFRYYEKLCAEDARIHLVRWEKAFNYSAINNFGAQYATGEHLLLLNNDTEIITPEWIEEMLMFSQRSDVGAVGAMLYYPDDTVQHAGAILGIGEVAGHAHKYAHRGSNGYIGRMTVAQNYSAVTAACVMIRRAVWDQVGGLEESFSVAFNDIDLCMRIRKAGFLIVWTPYAELYHYESKSRGDDTTPEKQARFDREVLRFQTRWSEELKAGDPYFNPNFDHSKEDFSIAY